MIDPGNRSENIEQHLLTGWQFRECGKENWFPASVPGCIHTDLLANQLIDDPFWRDNERHLQWIGEKDWEYQLQFDADPEITRHNYIELLFAGIDTYANINLNGQEILKADNMFHPWRAEVKRLLRETGNELTIHFCSPLRRERELTAKVKTLLPADNDQSHKTSSYTRKAPYHYGWDWGPCLITSGLWQPVSLIGWSNLYIQQMDIRQLELTDRAAFLRLGLKINTGKSVKAGLSIIANNVVLVSDVALQISPGQSLIEHDFMIKTPKRWWPAGLGEQHLYDIQAIVTIDGEQYSASQRIGLRTIEVLREKDSVGESFYFVVNKVAMFAKGANWVPADSFPTRLTDTHYRRLLRSAVDANMNMIRVWGGGIYEPQIFYDICDELGLMVWQDFMFACSMYPAGKQFLNSVERETRYQVQRLRNHPSLALWCGNNEIELAWEGWGWKKECPAQFWEDYKTIFHDLIPRICEEEDPSRLYWPSSPTSSVDHSHNPGDENRGDIHFWGVWHGKEPFEAFEKHRCRFMSEYGFQSFPELKTVLSYTEKKDHDIFSEVMKAHQRNLSGNEKINYYMTQYYNIPEDFASFLILSQIQQAHCIKAGAEFLRRSMPYCMGSLYWQLNDCWPVASWSSIDYYGRWKALHYYARRFYAPQLISPHLANAQTVDIYVVSDQRISANLVIELQLMTFKGDLLYRKTMNVEIEPLSSRIYYQLNLESIAIKRVIHQSLLSCKLIGDGAIISSNILYFSKPKKQKLPLPDIQVAVNKEDDQLTVELQATTVVRDVYLSTDLQEGYFEDNFFDLLPGELREIRFICSEKIRPSDFKQSLHITSLYALMK